MELIATITKYKVQLTYHAMDFEETNLGPDNDYTEKKEVIRDKEAERVKFIEELASKVGSINHHNLQYAVDNKEPFYYKLIVTKI